MPKRRLGTARPFVDWSSAKPFEVGQVDLKYIRDHKALSQKQIAHLTKYSIPNFQWAARASTATSSSSLTRESAPGPTDFAWSMAGLVYCNR
jgi:hypothetical protein